MSKIEKYFITISNHITPNLSKPVTLINTKPKQKTNLIYISKKKLKKSYQNSYIKQNFKIKPIISFNFFKESFLAMTNHPKSPYSS